jgi:hypothetical protein
MHYCPHCSHELIKAVKVCPYCKKMIDYKILAEVYQGPNSTEKNKIKLWKIWLKEHENIFMLIGGIFTGIIIGIIISSGYTQVQFKEERKGYLEKIAQMESMINKKNSETGDTINNYQKTLYEKNEIIKTLTDQKTGLASIIKITRTLTENCTVTPNSAEFVANYQNNMRNLKYQFYNLEDKLKEMTKDTGSSYNLNTIPQLLEE